MAPVLLLLKNVIDFKYSPTMRVMSYNIHKGIGGRDRRYKLQRIIDVIERENPDIICLQEVDHHVKRSRFDHQPNLLQKYFKYPAADFQWNHKIKSGGYGNYILSRFPFQSVSHVCLKLIHRKKRGAQIAVIDSPEGEFLLVNWHLGLAEKQRYNQVEHLFSQKQFRQKEDLPTMIVGDFNDWRNQLGKTQFEPRGFTQITRPPSRFRSFPAYMPLGSLDKAFVKGNFEISRARIVRNPLTHVASDHLPLVVDFHLKTPG